jgi:hypothetical protein
MDCPQRSIIDFEQYAKREINLPCSLVKDLDACAALQLQKMATATVRID